LFGLRDILRSAIDAPAACQAYLPTSATGKVYFKVLASAAQQLHAIEHHDPNVKHVVPESVFADLVVTSPDMSLAPRRPSSHRIKRH